VFVARRVNLNNDPNLWHFGVKKFINSLVFVSEIAFATTHDTCKHLEVSNLSSHLCMVGEIQEELVTVCFGSTQ
jgi:hypothetical protein